MADLLLILDSPAAAVSLGVASNAWFVLLDTAAQQLQMRGIPTGQIIFLRFIVTSPSLGIWLRMSHPDSLQQLLDPSSRLIWLRSLVAVTSLVFMISAFKFVPLSDAMALFHLRPFPIAFLCWLVLGEAVTLVQVAASVISFGAVLLVIQPEFLFHKELEAAYSHRGLGFLLVVGAMATSAIDIILVRKLSNKVTPPFMIFVHSIISLMISPILLVIERSLPVLDLGLTEILLIFSTVVFGLLGQVCLLVALQRVPGTTIAVLGYFQIVFAIISQVIFIGTWPTLLAVLGMVIIIAAGVWSVLKGSAPQDTMYDKSEQVEEDPPRRAYTPIPLEDNESV